MHHRHLRPALLMSALMVASLTAASPAAAAEDVLPDLKIAPLDRSAEYWSPRVVVESGRTRLRFDTYILNVGDGAFEVRGRPAEGIGCGRNRYGDPRPMRATKQIVYDAEGGRRRVSSDAVMCFKGDGHYHWHVWEIETYALYSLDDLEDPLLFGRKRGFCFFDGIAWDIDRPRAPRTYEEQSCGTRGTRYPHMGLSVGWADLYPWDFVQQWVDITGLPTGDYRLCVTADPQDFYLETRDDNNAAWIDLHLDPGAAQPAARLDRLDRGDQSPCDTGLPSSMTESPLI